MGVGVGVGVGVANKVDGSKEEGVANSVEEEDCLEGVMKGVPWEEACRLGEDSTDPPKEDLGEGVDPFLALSASASQKRCLSSSSSSPSL